MDCESSSPFLPLFRASRQLTSSYYFSVPGVDWKLGRRTSLFETRRVRVGLEAKGVDQRSRIGFISVSDMCYVTSSIDMTERLFRAVT